MGNVLDYVRREFRGFAELPFGDVDSLVLSELSYMRLTDLVPTCLLYTSDAADEL